MFQNILYGLSSGLALPSLIRSTIVCDGETDAWHKEIVLDWFEFGKRQMVGFGDLEWIQVYMQKEQY